MPRRIDQIQLIRLPIARFVHHAHRVGFDRDAPLPLQVHRVQNLRLHLSTGHRSRQFQKTVAQRRLPMVNVGNNCEISEVFYVHQRWVITRAAVLK